MYGSFVKRLLDIVCCIIGLLLFWWVFLIVGVLVHIKMGSPIIYKSRRIGKGEKSFEIYKFRSMTNETDENGVLLPGPQRLTKFGRMLRSTSLDEIPSIFNILKGEMSIVGPRPLPVKYLPYFYEHERVRHSVRPGLTGWAQVNGRNAVTWDDKFRMDIEYVEKQSFLMDVRVILKTVSKVIQRSDIIQDDQLTGSLYIVRADMDSREGKQNV